MSLVSDLLLIKQERSFKQENSEKDDRIRDSEEKNEHKEDKEDIEYGYGKKEDGDGKIEYGDGKKGDGKKEDGDGKIAYGDGKIEDGGGKIEDKGGGGKNEREGWRIGEKVWLEMWGMEIKRRREEEYLLNNDKFEVNNMPTCNLLFYFLLTIKTLPKSNIYL